MVISAETRKIQRSRSGAPSEKVPCIEAPNSTRGTVPGREPRMVARMPCVHAAGNAQAKRDSGAACGKCLYQRLNDPARVPRGVGIQEGGQDPAQEERHEHTLVGPGHDGPQC